MVTPPVPGSYLPKQSESIQIVDTPKSKGWHRIREVFIAEDLGTVKGKVFEGVVVPSIKDFIVNIVTNTVTMIFYGEKAVHTKGFTSSFLGGNNKRVSYSSYFASSLNGDNLAKKLAPEMVTSYSEPLFSTFDEAKECLNDLVEMLDNYPQVTVSDLYSHEAVAKNGYKNENVFNKWGWKKLGNAHVSATPNGYTLNLPRPKYLEEN